MEDNADLRDWELLHGSDLTDNYACVAVLDEDPSNFAFKDDYFAFGSGSSQRLQSEESDEGGIDSDNPSCPDSDSNTVLESSKEDLGFAGLVRDSGGFLLDESSDGKRSLVDVEGVELGRLEVSVVEMGYEESGRSDLREMTEIGEESDGGRLLGDSEHVEVGNLEASVMEMGSEESDRSDTQEMREIGGDAAINEVEKREKMWWNVPFGLLKYCLCGMRPVWSLSVAAAVVGLVMLWRKLYRMKKKSRIIPLKLAIDEKKTSQFAARSARLNAAFSVVRRMPAIRPSLQEGVATQWAALPFR